MSKIIQSTRTSLNGHDIYTMTRPHTDAKGRTWPIGTDYTASSAGCDKGRDYQDVVIRGERARFYA